MNRVSKLWHASKVLGSQNHIYLDTLHEQYGDIIRTGPSELTVFDPEVFNVISGAGTAYTKAAWYDILYPLVAMNSIREKTGYAPRRAKWDQAFKLTVKNEESKIKQYGRQLAETYRHFNGKAINVSDWFLYFGIDMMGELAFAKSFGVLGGEKANHALTIMRDGMSILGVVSPVPWLAQLASVIPGTGAAWKNMIAWCKEMVGESLQLEIEKPDVSYWLVEAARQESTEENDMNMNSLYGDAVLIAIAGSHTVGSTLTFIFLNLAKNAAMQTKLRSELQAVNWRSDLSILKDLPYINAVINETLRLYPVVPTGGNRLTGREGATIAGCYIPSETTIVAPRYTISRLVSVDLISHEIVESCFERADEFIPDRWTTKPEMIKDKRAFNPFNMVRHSCPGKNLGMLELRFVTALLVSQFDVAFAPGEDGIRAMRDLSDTFTANPGRLDLTFSPREKA